MADASRLPTAARDGGSASLADADAGAADGGVATMTGNVSLSLCSNSTT